MPTIGRTPNFALALPYGNRQNWTDLANGNWSLIDAVMATFVSVTNLQGVWTNNTAYVIGDNVIDDTAGVVYTAQVDHTSSGAPTTFLEERTNNPTYWTTFSVAARNRGAWQTATAYALNDFVLADGTKYAMCIAAHTSGANFSTDEALGRWEVMIDLSTAGSLVLPVLSGPADADKIVMASSGGTSYVINAASTLASLLNAAGLATLANPTFTGNPIAPTATAEDNDTSIATTQYADRAVRNLVIRVQTFSASGTYTANTKLISGFMKAAGGGGAGGGATSAVSVVGVGAGGGAGSISQKFFVAADVASPQTVTIGAAGTVGTAGNNPGGNGGDTSIGALCIGKGGTGGAGTAGAVGGTVSLGGLGGVAGTGDVTPVGMSGGSGLASGSYIISGAGGSSEFGSGGEGTVATTTTAGRAGTGRCSGGSGGMSTNGGGAVQGGAGTQGYAMVVELCYG